ncbi:hypothetical protein EH206_17210 [Brenneria nigrifluens DSM 30175 = ATCC 13028]|uniref:Uncharacterized protein n=2 Tax=Pectobacteriaceae TaxID=1903410 RepID=A0A2U1UW61_9GAMM|nr:hypothetical protein BrE312_3434 [Brenneria sp. EniD312]PWC25850.1 hypothetical protein DDT54_00505 [Brenneria nigrifluens DSM 30175 = ATCC 13028]QCR06999.1 hypothetical protein EH206_17210 [Brenneria nigrifluens DSM 30175 = ATCC 13028]
MKAYCTKNNILVTERTLKIFRKAIFSVPFDDNCDGRCKPTYYISIAILIQHLICSATASRNTCKKARFKGNGKWTCSVPFPYSLGESVAPAVFKQSRELPFERALEKLEAAKLIKIIRHDAAKHKCREFALSKRLLEALFPGDRKEYLQRKDRYSYLTDIYDKRQEPLTLEELVALASIQKPVVCHQVSKRKIPDTAFRERVKQVYDQLDYLHINLDALRDYCNAHPTSVNMMYYHNFISHLCDVGVKAISISPLIVAYPQSYKTARLGGRSFEVGKGFQYLPKGMKWACLAKGYNYDIKSSQLEILRHELVRIGVSPKNMKRLETSYISKKLGVDEDDVKSFRFSTIFNAGSVSLSFQSVTRKRLNKQLGEAEAGRVLTRWKKLMEPLKENLKRLIEDYLSSGNTNRYGLCVRSSVGQNFNCTWKNVRKAKKWQTSQMRRKLLAHMLQGLESRAIYDYVASHNGVCALEHDGFVSLSKLSDDDWKHPYLRIVLKNEAQE